MRGSTTVEEMADTAQQQQHDANVPEGRVREIVEAWLRAGGTGPHALQADLTAMFIDGDESQLGFETWRLVAETVETGWADEQLADALSSALSQDAERQLAGALDAAAATPTI